MIEEYLKQSDPAAKCDAEYRRLTADMEMPEFGLHEWREAWFARAKAAQTVDELPVIPDAIEDDD